MSKTFSLSAGVTFIVLMWLTIITGVVSLTFTRADNVKHWLSQTNAYSQGVDIALALMSDLDVIPPELEPVAIEAKRDESELRAEALSLFTSSYLQESAEGLIDGVFDWLDGTTQYPELSVSPPSDTEGLSRLLMLVLLERANALPICDAEITNFDPVNAQCIPDKMSTEQTKLVIQSQLDTIGPAGLTADILITPAQLGLDSQTSSNIQNSFRTIKIVPLTLGLALALVGVAFMLSTPRKYRSLIAAASIALPSALLFIAGLIAVIQTDAYLQGVQFTREAMDPFLEEFLLGLIRNVYETLSRTMLMLSGLFVLTGISLPLLFRLIQKRQIAGGENRLH